MIINLLKKSSATPENSTLVVFSRLSKDKKSATLTHSKLNQHLASAVADKLITGKHLELVTFRELNFPPFRHVAVVGIGAEAQLNEEAFRQVGACCYDTAKQTAQKDILIDFDGLGFAKSKAASYLKAFVEGLKLASYDFDELKSKAKEDSKTKQTHFHIETKWATDAAVKNLFSQAIIMSDCINFSRRLGDMPGNLMTPTILAEEAAKASKGTGIKMQIWDKARIKKEKMGGLLGVSMGSDQEPRFIIMEYKGGNKSDAPLVFVGKGLTFDSGGISIKPSAGMEEMKYDMCGGANVIGTLLAIAKLKLKVNAVGLVAASENMPGPSATKPGDIHFARNGKSFEVNNTDAEGRLILSDALSYATELKPKMIVDAATLTGAMVVALGNIHTGYFTRNASLKNKIEKAAQASGEWVWNMPLTDFHGKDMKGTYADLSNMSSSKGAGSATAAAFLENFVGEGIPWAHFDIAGTGWSVGNRLNYCPKKGASGVMIRTFVELAKSF